MFLQPGKIILKLIWSSKAARKAKITSKTNRKTERLSTTVLTLTQLSVNTLVPAERHTGENHNQTEPRTDTMHLKLIFHKDAEASQSWKDTRNNRTGGIQ